MVVVEGVGDPVIGSSAVVVGLDARHPVADPRCLVVRVDDLAAPVISRRCLVALVVDLDREAAAVEHRALVGLDRRTGAVVDPPGEASLDDAPRPMSEAVGQGRVVHVVAVDHRSKAPTGRVGLAILADSTGQPVRIRARQVVDGRDGDGLRRAVGVLVAVHAAVVEPRRRRGPGGGLDLGMASVVRPRLGRCGQDRVIAVVPRRGVLVRVVRDLIRRPAGDVVRFGLGDHPLVGDRPTAGLAVGLDPDREAVLVVLVPVAGHVGAAVGGLAVREGRLAAELLTDEPDPRHVRRFDAQRRVRVGPVREPDPVEIHRRHDQRRSLRVAGALDLVEPQLHLTGGARRWGRHRLDEVVAVDVLRGALGDRPRRGDDGGQSLGREERGRVVPRAVARVRADQVDRHIGVVRRVGRRHRRARGRRRAEGVRAAIRGVEHHLRRRVLPDVTLGVLDAGDDPAPRVLAHARRIALPAVVVGLRGPEDARHVAVDIDDAIEVPPPGLIAEGVVEARGMTRVISVVAEHGHRPRRVRRCVRAGLASVPEPVLGAIGRGHHPELVVVIAVHAVEAMLHPPVRVILQAP